LGIIYKIHVQGIDATVVLEDEQKFWESKYASAKTLARFAWAIERNEPVMVAAILSGETTGLDADQKEVVETLHPIVEALKTQAAEFWNDTSHPYEQGKMLGNILGQ